MSGLYRSRPRPWLSVIIPTMGRVGLADTLASIRSQERDPEHVEIIVVGDTYRGDFRNELARSVPLVRGWGGIYWPHDGRGHAWGHPQRSFGQRVASGRWLWWLQDDDVAEPGALEAIQTAAGAGYGAGWDVDKILLFKAEPRPGLVVWQDKEVRHGNVDADCIVAPRDLTRLPDWGRDHGSDATFIADMADLYEGRIAWVDQLVARHVPSLSE